MQAAMLIKSKLVFFELIPELAQCRKRIAAFGFGLGCIGTGRRFRRTCRMTRNIRQSQDQFIFNLFEDIKMTRTEHFFVTVIELLIGDWIVGIEFGFRPDQL